MEGEGSIEGLMDGIGRKGEVVRRSKKEGARRMVLKASWVELQEEEKKEKCRIEGGRQKGCD